MGTGGGRGGLDPRWPSPGGTGSAKALLGNGRYDVEKPILLIIAVQRTVV